MTEVPEHLLKRSKDRRTSLDGGTPAADAAPAAESAPVESNRFGGCCTGRDCARRCT